MNREKIWFSLPGEVSAILEQRIAKLGFRNVKEYMESLVAYDLWAERDHLYTGDSCRGSTEDKFRMWSEVIAFFGKPNKTGSFFEVVARAFVRAKDNPSNR